MHRTDLYPSQLDGQGGGYTVVRQPLTEGVIHHHLAGRLTLGLYSAPNSTTKWLCLDIDALDENPILRLRQRLDRLHIPYLTEFSGRKGYHIWIFFNSSLPNRVARTLGKALTQKHEVFPKQGYIPKGAVGNLVKAPLGIHRVIGARCLFVDDNLEVIPDQETSLAQVGSIDPCRVLKRHFPKAWARARRAHGCAPSTPASSTGPRITPAEVPFIKDCVLAAIREGAEAGTRNQVGYIIATELRRTGIRIAEACTILLSIWNPGNRPPLSEVEVETIIESAYSGQGRTFGCRAGGALREVTQCVGRRTCLYSQITRNRPRTIRRSLPGRKAPSTSHHTPSEKVVRTIRGRHRPQAKETVEGVKHGNIWHL